MAGNIVPGGERRLTGFSLEQLDEIVDAARCNDITSRQLKETVAGVAKKDPTAARYVVGEFETGGDWGEYANTVVTVTV